MKIWQIIIIVLVVLSILFIGYISYTIYKVNNDKKSKIIKRKNRRDELNKEMLIYQEILDKIELDKPKTTLDNAKQKADTLTFRIINN